MKTHNLTQGSREWHAYRAQHFNASDAPAMLGVSPYKTRDQLLHELHTGLAPEVDPQTQRRFDAGHAAEAAARPLAEEILGEDLYPVTGSIGELSASFDGLTMDERIVWEHKLMNVDLAESLADGVIPNSYHPQLEQQLLVSGAEKALFMATSVDKTAMEYVWYVSNPEMRQRLIAGWRQFAIDLAAYTPTAPTVAAVAAPVESLPAVSVRLDGQLVVASNLPEFGAALRAFIERIPTSPSTDQQFADCESACKALKKAEDALESSETHALAQMVDVNDLRRTIADLRNLARQTRLASEKAVTARKEQVRLEIVQDGNAALRDHIIALNKRLGHQYMPAIIADFNGAIKGKRTVDSLRDAVNTTLANAKIEASAIADRIQANLETKGLHGYAFLFADLSTICTKAPEDFQNTVTARITAHEAAQAAKEAALVARIEAEAKEKTEREAKAKLEAERRQAREEEDALVTSLWANARRIERDSVAYIQKAIGMFETAAIDWENDPRPRVAETVATARAEMKSKLNAAQSREASEAFAQLERDETARLAKLNSSIVVEAAPVVPVSTVVTMPVRAPAAPTAQASPPTLRLGQINDRLSPIQINADGLRALGFEPAATDRASKLYFESEFTHMCAALVQHINGIQATQAA